MARSGMQTLIDTVRGFADADPEEQTVESGSSIVTYWSDEEIQRVLDRHKTEYIHALMDAQPTYESGSSVFKQYLLGTGCTSHLTATRKRDFFGTRALTNSSVLLRVQASLRARSDPARSASAT